MLKVVNKEGKAVAAEDGGGIYVYNAAGKKVTFIVATEYGGGIIVSGVWTSGCP